MTRDKSSTIQVLRAPFVVFDHPIWNLFKIIDDDLFPRDLLENARKLEQYNGDEMCINMGLSRLPMVRATGRPETYVGFNRILRGPERVYGSGWWINSQTSKKQAPKGKHLFATGWGTAGPGCQGFEPFRTFQEAKAKVDTILDYARRYYKNLDDVTEWMTYNLVKAPTTIGFLWKPILRIPLQVPDIRGLYLVGATAEVEGCYQDIQANSALQVTDLILQGRSDQKRG